MATVNPEIFQKFKNAQKLPARQEGDGHEIEVEVREDEEQSVKLQEIVDLLVAAGYFRARIKGLSSFDKVVGGMTWCIESCNIDVDVDLLFQENSTIGQKIALTEKIVAVLPKLKCPHRIEPHQIQGLDFIHIFPVIQWLVKRSLEYRQEVSEFVRLYAVKQYEKNFAVEENVEKQKLLIKNVNLVKDVYRPIRYYKRKNAPPPDIASRVQITLLEYGHRPSEASGSKSETQEEIVIEKQKSEETQIEQLLSGLTNAQQEIVDYNSLTEEEKAKLAKHYKTLQSELKDGGKQTKKETQLSLLKEQTQILNERLSLLQLKNDSLEKLEKESKTKLEDIKQAQILADKVIEEFEQTESSNPQFKEFEDLVILQENLKGQESQFRKHCKEELVRLQNLIEETKKARTPTESLDFSKELEEETENVRIVRLQLAKKNRTVSALQRQLDEVPNRAELAQYQRRFLELYNQVAAKHKETKQYYTLYNTLEDTRLYMKKELSLLNSISDSYPEAMNSSLGKQEFLKQFRNIVEGVKQSKCKVERRLVEEKAKRDQLSNFLQGLIEQQRKYAAAVRQLSIECQKHERLMAESGMN